MISQPKLNVEFSTTGARYKVGDEQATSSASIFLLIGQFTSSRPEPLPNTSRLSDVLARFESNPSVQKAMEPAREYLADVLHDPRSLPFLRMKAGLSQAQLAKKISTSQSHIARIELGTNDPTTDLIDRIAQALNVMPSVLFDAVRYQRELADLKVKKS